MILRAGKTEWAHALAGGLSVCGAEGSFAGLTANVPETVINSKVDLMQMAQQSFVSFWIWSGVFFAYLLAYHVFNAYGIGISWDTMFKVFVTILLSAVVYLVFDYLVESLKRDEGDNDVPNVEEEIRLVCMMPVSMGKDCEK